MLLSGCGSDEVVKPISQTKSNSANAKYMTSAHSIGWVTYIDWGLYADCAGPASNCFDPYPSSWTQPAGWDEETDILDQAVAAGREGVAGYFTNGDYLTLFPNLATDEYRDMLLLLRSGDYSMYKTTDPTTHYGFYLVGEGTASKSNFDFVLALPEAL